MSRRHHQSQQQQPQRSPSPNKLKEDRGGDEEHRRGRSDDSNVRPEGTSSLTTLPAVESTPLLVLRFAPHASHRLVGLVTERLRSEGLIVLTTTKLEEDAVAAEPERGGRAAAAHATTTTSASTMLTLTTSEACLEEAAESIHLVKRTVEGIVDRFTVQERHRFVRADVSSATTTTTSASAPCDALGLFLPCEWYLLAHHLLERIEVLPTGVNETELSCALRDDCGIDCHVRIAADANAAQTLSDRRLERLLRHQDQSDHLIHALQAHGLVESVAATHLPALRNNVMTNTWKWNQLEPPIDLIHNYYGWDVAFYFAWMGFLSRWLAFPGALGLLVFVWRWYRGDTLDEDEYTPFYGIVTFFWAVLFLRFWERHEKRLSYRWGTGLLTEYERQKYGGTRPGFRGYLRLSPVTGEPEVYYPAARRRIKFVGSALVTLFMLLVAFVVMIASLNLQGYIRPKSNPLRWDESSPHPFHLARFAALAEADQIFDAASWWRALLPAVIHVACINALNKIYRVMAEILTNWENHETELNHRNSYALKRFLFEAFDCYIALFYLAFYERDVERLKLELVTIFQIDTFRRVASECLLPLALLLFGSHVAPDFPRTHRGGVQPAPIVPPFSSVRADLEKDVYDQFDDYMEILIQFGYTTLFASAYPLASLISIAANWVEIRMDLFKLSHLHQRPFPQRSSDLGIWRPLLSTLVWMSALTNCLLAGFTSDQLMHYLPDFYLHDRSGFTTLEHDKGWLLVFVIFGLERLLLVLGLLLYVTIPDVPEDVTDELERRHYVHTQQRENRRSNRRIKKDN